jgi:regulator of protease activity HflC (stomatin/prohibitin superfamily)
MKLFTITVGLLVIVAGLFVVFTEALSLLNTQDTLSVCAGYLALSMFVSLGIYFAAVFARKLSKALTSVGIVCLLSVSGCSCTTIEPGHVGIKVQLTGGNRGVQDLPLVTGRVFYNPMNETIFQYPTYTQTVQWTKSATEGNPNNEELTFSSKEGLNIAADVNLSYSIKAEQVPKFYVKFRNDDLNTYTYGYMRNIARDTLNDLASTYSVEEIYGVKKEELRTKTLERLNTSLSEIGVHVDQFGFIGALRLPDNVVSAINAKIKATQDAIRVENELRMTQASAAKQVAEAEGAAQSHVKQAEGNAQAALIEATGKANANMAIIKSITPELIQWERLSIQKQAVYKWDGKQPQTILGGNSTTILDLKQLQ